MANNQELIAERSQDIFKTAHDDLQGYLTEKVMSVVENAQDKKFAMHVDFITIGAQNEDEDAQLSEAVASLAVGARFEIEGAPVFEIPELELPTPMIRVEPSSKVGGARDGVAFAFGLEAFPIVKGQMIANVSYPVLGTDTVRKQQEGSDSVSYTFVRTSNPRDVVVTALSTSVVSVLK